MKRKRIYVVWFIFGIVNLIFAATGRGDFYFIVSALFFVAGYLGYLRSQKPPVDKQEGV